MLALSVQTVWKALRQIFDFVLSTVVLQCGTHGECYGVSTVGIDSVVSTGVK